MSCIAWASPPRAASPGRWWLTAISPSTVARRRCPRCSSRSATPCSCARPRRWRPESTITSTPVAASCHSVWRSSRTSAVAWCGACRSAKTSRFLSASSSSSSCIASRSRAPMPRIPFQRPKKVEWEILSDRYGRLVAEPFEKGYALTVGNSLRRTLLAIVPGAAVSWVRIDGVKSVETKIPGVKENTVDVLLNIKKLAIQVPSGEAKVLRIEVTGPKVVTGADVPETDIEVVNPEIHLFTIESSAKVTMELGVGMGRGYEAVDRATSSAPAGALAIDAAYSPITRVAYNVEMSRLGKITDYEKLVLEVWTNGSVSPDDALTRASSYLKDHFHPLAVGVPREDEEAEGAEGEAFLRDALAKTLEELALPARAINALKNAELNLVVDLVQKNEGDLEHVKNLGEKSIDEIKTALAALGLSLGMRIDPNVLGALGRGAVK